MVKCNVRILSNLKVNDNEPLIYVQYKREGWVSLRQICTLFFPGVSVNNMTMTIWCSKHITSSKYYNTPLSDCECTKIRDKDTQLILRDLRIEATYFVDVHSVKIILNVLNPHTSAKTLIAFNNVLTEILRKGGRKRTVSTKERMKIAAVQGWKCKMCDVSFGDALNFEIDHILQFSKGGSNRHINLQALCPNCHSLKSEKDKNKIFEEFRYLSV